MVLKFVIVDVMCERHRFSDAGSTAWSSVFSVLTGWVNSLKKEINPTFRKNVGLVQFHSRTDDSVPAFVLIASHSTTSLAFKNFKILKRRYHNVQKRMN